MIVCVCHNINEEELDSLILDNKGSLKHVQIACKVGTHCGSCLDSIKQRCEKFNDENLCDLAVQPTNEK